MKHFEQQKSINGRLFQCNEAYDEDNCLVARYYERFVPETSVRVGGFRHNPQWEDRHAHWRLVSPSHRNLRVKLDAAFPDVLNPNSPLASEKEDGNQD